MRENTQYERFNEALFEAYCKTAIDNAILKERERKGARGRRQLSLSALTDAVLYALAETDGMEAVHEESSRVFTAGGADIPIFDGGLAQAISFLMPRDREIILRYYFLDMTDERIAKSLGMAVPTVNRRRRAAKEKMRGYLEGGR